MRLFIYEMLSAGGLAGAPLTLLREGAAMLEAVVADFARIADVEVATILAHEFPRSIDARCQRVSFADEANAFHRMAAAAKEALIIAPEFDDLLATRSQWALDAGNRLLGSTPTAIRLTGDKLALAAHLQSHQVSTIATLPLDHPGNVYPRVLKPRFGAGSQATFLVRDAPQWNAAVRQAQQEWPNGDWIVQPYHAGQAVSVSLLVGPRQTVVTPGATQRLTDDGRFHYLGGVTPLPRPIRGRATALAQRAAATVPGLHGYVGVDLVLGSADDGSQDVVVEINPRLTTSYLGLRRLAQSNLAEVWWTLARGETVAEIVWQEDKVAFDGR